MSTIRLFLIFLEVTYHFLRISPRLYHVTTGTRVIWGVPFGQGNITAAYLETQSILKAFGSPAVQQQGISLEFLEIGNEADLYAHHGLRNSTTWNVETYIDLCVEQFPLQSCLWSNVIRVDGPSLRSS